jgi:hypothetical protein
MGVSRRMFLSRATGAVGSCIPLLSWRLSSAGRNLRGSHGTSSFLHPQETRLACALFDLKQGCGLRESLAGYESALARMNCRFLTMPTEGVTRSCLGRVAIVPGCVTMDAATASTLAALLQAGALVLLESGGAFARAAEFRRHREFLAARFGVEVEVPVDLWQRPSREGRVPYVDYVWPMPLKVRDFSRVVPLSRSSSEVVGRAGSLPVALRRSVDGGVLLFLGSPLGPALLAGDPEAQNWLREILQRRF